jgi:hypothetical protein
MKDDAAFGEQMMKGIIKPYQQENSQGKYAEAAGRGVFDIGSIILTEGAGAGVEGAANVARGAEVAGDATKGLEVTANIAKTEEVVADVSKGREAVTDTSKMSGADQAANVVNGTGGGRMELRPFRRGPTGAWVNVETGLPVTDAAQITQLEDWEQKMASSHIPLP